MSLEGYVWRCKDEKTGMGITVTHERVEKPFKGRAVNEAHRYNEEQLYVGGYKL